MSPLQRPCIAPVVLLALHLAAACGNTAMTPPEDAGTRADAGPPDAGDAADAGPERVLRLELRGRESFGVDTCSPAFELAVVDEEGEQVAAPADLELTRGVLLFFEDAACTEPLAAPALASGGEGLRFHVRGSTRGTFPIEARGGGLVVKLDVHLRRAPEQLALGAGHSCATFEGELWCAGYNVGGQLGDGTRNSRMDPVRLALPGSPSTLAVSHASAEYDEGHSCAIVDRKLYCWGKNDFGQVDGVGVGAEAAPPELDALVPVDSGLSEVTGVATGTRHTCALAADGIWCLGADYARPWADRRFRIDLPGAKAISAGTFFSCAITADERVACWGWNPAGPLGDGTTRSTSATPAYVPGVAGAKKLAAGGHHSCAILEGGAVACWGDNSTGQLGIGSTAKTTNAGRAKGLASGVTSIAAGIVHTCAVRDSALYCWGLNPDGQLGIEGLVVSYVPVPVPGFEDGVTDVFAGDRTTCVRRWGELSCWGSAEHGQLGDGDSTGAVEPTRIPGLERGASAITVGRDHACAIREGRVFCWGDNRHGQLGHGAQGGSAPEPVAVAGIEGGASALVSGPDYSCALVDGGVRCWGQNLAGILGRDPALTPALAEPVAIPGLEAGVTAIAGLHAGGCAVKQGALLCWGARYEDGTGASVAPWAARPVGGFASGVTGVGAGIHSGCAVRDGASFCWGRGDLGQLFTGTAIGSVYRDWSRPVAASALTGAFTDWSGGATRACAISGGRVFCAGENTFGGLGDGSRTWSTVPVEVLGISGATRLAASGGVSWHTSHACAVADGELMCWGFNGYGQLGDGTTENRSTPVRVRGLSGVSAAAVSPTTSCAVAQGAAWCWGAESLLGRGPARQAPPHPVEWD